MKKIFPVILTILLAVSTLFAEGKWTKVEISNFTLVGSASEKELRNVGNKLEQFRQTLSLIMPTAKLESSVPTTVYVFDSYDEFQSYFQYAKNERKIGGIFISTAEANYISLSIEKRNYDVFDVIFHEYFHYVLRRNLVRAPLWLHEGMAEYFSTFEIDESGTKTKIGMPLPRRIAELRSRNFLPLEKLFAVNGKSPDYRESDKVGIFYAESWALVHFMMNANKGARQKQFYDFIDLVTSGTAPDIAFQKSFSADYKQIEKELQNYIERLSFPFYEIKLPQKVSRDESAKTNLLSETETKILQGSLLRYTGSSESAEKKLLEALNASPKNAEIYRLLGGVYDSRKENAEARRNYEKALELDRNNYLNYYNLIKFLREDKNYDEAVKYGQQAIKLNPGDVRVYVALGGIYENIFKDEEALQAYSQALKLSPNYGVNYFNFAKVAFRNNKNEVALAAAQVTLDLDNWINNNSVKAALIVYFISRRENKGDRAAGILKLGLEKIEAKNFYHSVFRYLNKEIGESELLSLAKDTNDQTISNLYIGLNLLLEGKKIEAKTKFQWIKENGNRDFTEYGYAIKQLERLETDQ